MADKVKVGILTTHFYSPGGVARTIKEIVSRLEKIEGLEFEIITTRVKGDWHKELESSLKPISWFPHPSLAYMRPNVKNRLEKYDVLWVHDWFLLKPVTDIETPSILTYHTRNKLFTGFNRDRGLKSKLNRYFEKKGMNYIQFADRCVGISEYSKDQLNETYKGKSVKIMHGGNIEGASYSDKDEEYIFCPNGVDESIERISKKYPVKAIGSEPSDYEGTIEWVGKISDDQTLCNYYKDSSFVISPSGNEGFGITVVEAAFCGKPCVVRAVGGHKETVKHQETGFLAQNSKEFHEYVKKMWNDESLRKEMGEAAHRHAKDNFTWEISASEYLAEINDLAGSSLNMPED